MEDGREWWFSDKIGFTVIASLSVNFSDKKSYSITAKHKNVIWSLMTFKRKLKKANTSD